MVNTDAPVSSVELLRSVEEAAGVGTWLYVLSGGTVRWSPGLRRIFGVDLEMEASPNALTALIHPEDRRSFEERVSAIVSAGVGEQTFRIIRPDGQLRWINSRSTLFHNPDGQPSHIIGVVQDVTVKREAERTVTFHGRVLSAASRVTNGIVWHAELDDESRPMMRVLYAPMSLSGRSRELINSCHPEDVSVLQKAWLRAVRDGGQVVERYRVHNGTDWVEAGLHGIPIMIESNQRPAWIGVLSFAPPGETTTSARWEGQAAALSQETPLSPMQVQVGRTCLGWTAKELAEAAGISYMSVRRAEEGQVGIKQSTLSLIRVALESNGIQFTATSDGRRGVYWRTDT